MIVAQLLMVVVAGILAMIAFFLWSSMRGEAKTRKLAPVRVRVENGKHLHREAPPEEEENNLDILDMFFGLLLFLMFAAFLIQIF